jgi:hypothetical protein
MYQKGGEQILTRGRDSSRGLDNVPVLVRVLVVPVLISHIVDQNDMIHLLINIR